MSRRFRGKFYHAMRKNNKSVDSYVRGFPVTRKGWGSGTACWGRHRGDFRIEWSQAKYRHQTFSWVLILYSAFTSPWSLRDFQFWIFMMLWAKNVCWRWSGSGELYNILLIFLPRLVLFNPVVTNHVAVEHGNIISPRWDEL